MRIISGTARGRKLAEFKGNSIRPTSDRVREALFSSLVSQRGSLNGTRVLDLYAGTGALAIEALSRGADSAILVDFSAESESLVNGNLRTTRLADKGRFLRGNVLSCLPKVVPDGPFDLIFIDPPYADEGVEEILLSVIRFGLLQTDGIICIETASSRQLQAEIGRLVCSSRRRYGSTAVSFYVVADSGDHDK